MHSGFVFSKTLVMPLVVNINDSVSVIILTVTPHREPPCASADLSCIPCTPPVTFRLIHGDIITKCVITETLSGKLSPCYSKT